MAIRRAKDKVLRPVWPNAGIEADYRARMARLIAEMARSYEHFLKAQYRRTPPTMATDATPARELERELRRLGIRWERRFEAAAPRLARYFATSIYRRSSDTLRRILRDAGIAVEFKMTRPMRDVLDATVAENVSLIKSIASQYHSQVEGAVMRSVAAGRDLAPLVRELQERHGVSLRQAKTIALHQNNMATSAMTRVRQEEAGIERAKWLHSHAGKKPRPTHLANDGKIYNVAEGWYDPDPKVRRRIFPGELISCRCVSKPIVKGFS